MALYRLAVDTLVALSRGRTSVPEILRQVNAAGVEGLAPALFLGVLVGGVGVARATGLLAAVGSQHLANELVVLLVRDAGPLLTALLVLVRSGASVAVDVGSAQGSPGERALPRILGLQLSVLALYVFFASASLAGASVGAPPPRAVVPLSSRGWPTAELKKRLTGKWRSMSVTPAPCLRRLAAPRSS